MSFFPSFAPYVKAENLQFPTLSETTITRFIFIKESLAPLLHAISGLRSFMLLC